MTKRALRRDIFLSQLPVVVICSILCTVCAGVISGASWHEGHRLWGTQLHTELSLSNSFGLLTVHLAVIGAFATFILWICNLLGLRALNRVLRNIHSVALACDCDETPTFDYEEFEQVASAARRAQANSRLMDRQRAQILDSLPWGYSVLNSCGRYVEMNRRGAEILGVAPDEVLGKSPADIPRGPAVEPQALKVLRERQTVEGILSVTVQGQTRFVRETCFPITLEDDDRGAMMVYVDITDQVEMERSLQRLARLGSLDETLSIVAHDIRNPLAAIKSRAQMAVLMGDRLDHQQEWGRVSALVDDITAYLTQLLTHCRPAGDDIEVCSVRELFRRSMTILQSRIIYSDVQLSEEIEEPSPRIAVNPVEFGHVLTNLLNNALEAIHGHGSITFAARQSDENVVIEIRDTGTGIQPEQMSRIWEMFYTTKTTGSGIGLAVCKRAIERMGGTIAVSSIPDIGTTFTATLPAASITLNPAPSQHAL